MTKRTVPASNFLAILSANVDDVNMTGADFRKFVRDTLPIVQTADDEWNLAIAACNREVSSYLNGRTNMGDHYGSYYAGELNNRISRVVRRQ